MKDNKYKYARQSEHLNPNVKEFLMALRFAENKEIAKEAEQLLKL
tara:strand:+ start:194 stop:328 length:135 start_codon:yes stop_codon:yes gene_type:complete